MIPPFRFGTVEEGLYRAALPTPRNYTFLRQLGLRSMVSLVPDLNPQLEEFADQEGITVKLIRVSPRVVSAGQRGRAPQVAWRRACVEAVRAAARARVAETDAAWIC